MNADRGARGQPLLVMAVILGSWLAVRVFLWEVPIQVQVRPTGSSTEADRVRRAPAPLVAGNTDVDSQSVARSRSGSVRLGPIGAAVRYRPALPAALNRTGRRQWASLSGVLPPPRAAPGLAGAPEPGRASFQIAEMQAPAAGQVVAAPVAAADRPLLGIGHAQDYAPRARWSGDAWLLWRGGSSAAVAPGITAYGRSQAGAVLRYRLDLSSALRPTVYVRATGALQSPGQGEVAAGIALRAVPNVPVSFAVEGRVTDTDTGRRVRSAAFAVTELPPARLPLGLEGEAYIQAGYVGGRYRTAFVDGQGRVSSRIARLGSGDGLRVGVAAWGGAQRDTSRLDIGPSATLSVRVGQASARLAADYRFRIAGTAAPASGPALTLSAGF